MVTRNERLRDCLGIVGAALLPALLLRPFRNMPFQDDWLYAWRVEWFLQRGELRLLGDIAPGPVGVQSGNPNLAQVLWGALASRLFGFSFTTLQISTWILAVVCLCGLYLLLRELQGSRRDSLIATAVLGLNPIFFTLTFTFMTEVPLLAAIVWCSLAMARALRLRSLPWLGAAMLLALAAIGVRVVAVALPVAMALTLFLHDPEWGRRKARFLLPLAPLALTLAPLVWWWSGVRAEHPVGMMSFLMLGPKMVPGFIYVGLMVGLALLPLSVAYLGDHGILRRWIKLFLVMGVSVAGIIVAVSLFVSPRMGLNRYWFLRVLPPANSFWAVTEVSSLSREIPKVQSYEERRARIMPMGTRIWPDVPLWLALPVTAAGLASFAAILACLRRRPATPAEKFLLWAIAGQFLLFCLLNGFHDRYVLPLAPLLIAMLVGARRIARPAVSIVLTAVIGIGSLVVVRDYLEFDRTLWGAVEELRGRGARDWEINAGYFANCWLWFAHRDHAPRAKDGQVAEPGDYDVLAETQRFSVAHSPLPNHRVMRVIPYKGWLGRDGSIHILEAEKTPPAR